MRDLGAISAHGRRLLLLHPFQRIRLELGPSALHTRLAGVAALHTRALLLLHTADDVRVLAALAAWLGLGLGLG